MRDIFFSRICMLKFLVEASNHLNLTRIKLVPTCAIFAHFSQMRCWQLRRLSRSDGPGSALYTFGHKDSLTYSFLLKSFSEICFCTGAQKSSPIMQYFFTDKTLGDNRILFRHLGKNEKLHKKYEGTISTGLKRRFFWVPQRWHRCHGAALKVDFLPLGKQKWQT